MNRIATAFACLLLAGLLGACSGLGNRYDFDGADAAAANAELDSAVASLAAGDAIDAFDRMRALWEIEDMPASLRGRLEMEMERASREVVPQADSPRYLRRLADEDLPRRARVEIAVGAAQRYLDRGKRLAAYRAVKKLDLTFPSHHRRAEAADVLATAGFSLADDDGRSFFFFPVRDNAHEVLEYLVLHFPSSSHCAQAYATLARLYEDDQEWQLAIERHEDLLIYHPESELALASEARIPHLRLRALRLPQYSREEMLRARAELEGWLDRNSGHALEESVRADLGRCLVRLYESDVAIARFYDRIDEPWGARQHAERAIAEANAAGDEARAREGEKLLSSLPESAESGPR